MPLMNIATRAAAPSEVSESLLTATEQGKKAMVEFVQSRLILDKENSGILWRKSTSKPFKI